MSTTAPNPGQSWQPAPQYPQQPQYAQAPQPQYAPQSSATRPTKPAATGSVLRRWPAWAQNTALAVGAVAILVVVFFAGYFTAHAVDGGTRPGFGTNQNFTPRQFGGNGNGFGGQSGNGFGGQPGNGSGGQSGQSGDGFGGQSGNGS
ncbi:hypothetical protein ACPPVW_11785 [Leifsonia sp. McL0607]|uniref:hypothetical protein n=1 Tax=Leifsonia sp. McL0607 TaxID=3415672 RepID=UPI003CED86A6